MLDFALGGTEMANFSGIVKQLKKERDRVRKQLLGLETALTAFAIAYSGSTPSPKRRMSAKSRAKIAAAQRARWAKVRKSKA
jgi:ABC-type phosphate transport system substrate-binding protein